MAFSQKCRCDRQDVHDPGKYPDAVVQDFTFNPFSPRLNQPSTGRLAQLVERRPYKADATSSSLVPPTRNLRDLRNKRRKSLFLLAVSEEMADAFLKFRRNSQEPPQVWSPPAKRGNGLYFHYPVEIKQPHPMTEPFFSNIIPNT